MNRAGCHFHWSPGWGRRLAGVVLGLGLLSCAWAQPASPNPAIPAETVDAERSVSDWLMRMHEASRRRAYIGTFVVSSSAGNLSSARIWHVCDGEQQMERVESLTGTPRSTFRHNDQVITFLPGSKIARAETRESLGLFPNGLKADDSAIAAFYTARQEGSDRVAGVDADVLSLQPRDRQRYAYRVWSEKKSGLVVKLQTLDLDGRVLEQAAFSELQMDAPVRMDKLAQMMAQTSGYKVETSRMQKTTAAAEGWVLRSPVAGFKSMNCYKRSSGTAGALQDSTVQWVFSDGLASVSLFLEAYDRQRHNQEGLMSLGATQTLSRKLADKSGEWWLTAVGEVPVSTLKTFASGLERRK